MNKLIWIQLEKQNGTNQHSWQPAVSSFNTCLVSTRGDCLMEIRLPLRLSWEFRDLEPRVFWMAWSRDSLDWPGNTDQMVEMMCLHFGRCVYFKNLDKFGWRCQSPQSSCFVSNGMGPNGQSLRLYWGWSSKFEKKYISPDIAWKMSKNIEYHQVLYPQTFHVCSKFDLTPTSTTASLSNMPPSGFEVVDTFLTPMRQLVLQTQATADLKIATDGRWRCKYYKTHLKNTTYKTLIRHWYVFFPESIVGPIDRIFDGFFQCQLLKIPNFTETGWS